MQARLPGRTLKIGFPSISCSRYYSSRPPETPLVTATNTGIVKPRKKITVRALQQMHASLIPISMVTAYDYPSARFCEEAGVDICLVGDSLAMVACGYSSTTEIGMDEMLYHCRAVARGAKTPMLLADMPFGSHQPSMELGITNAVRMIKEGKMDAVKIEGGEDIVPLVKNLVNMGIPVMGHVGLMPQRQVRSDSNTSQSLIVIISFRPASSLRCLDTECKVKQRNRQCASRRKQWLCNRLELFRCS